MIIPIIRRSNLILQHKMSSILSISHSFRLANQFPHTSQRILLTLWITLIEDNHRNMMHFTPSDAECRQDIESVLSADALTERELAGCISSSDGRDGTESDVGTIGQPINPV